MSQLLDRAVLQLHVTAQFYLENKENTSLRHEGMPIQKTRREERERERAGERESRREGERPRLWLLFQYVFSPPPGSALCKLG